MIVDRDVTVSDQLTLVLLSHCFWQKFSKICLLSEAVHQQTENYWHINVLLCKFLRFAAM
jgi:hypothetical protein